MKHVLTRYHKNPILTPDMMPFECYTVLNSAAIRIKDEVLLLMRVEDWKRETRFHVARSKDGVNFVVEPEP